MWKGRVVLHVDMNAFFASVEQKCNPLLRGKPIVIVGDLSRRSVVLTASYEARVFGIKTGMLLHEAQSVCPKVVPVEGRFQKYLTMSEEILNLLNTFTERVEMTSCDEAYLDVTPQGGKSCDPATLGILVHDRIRDELGLPCSVGVAPNKLLAKLASDMKKPNGITVIHPDSVQAVLAEMPVEKLYGVGNKMKGHLNAMGITTCGDLGRTSIEILYPRFGVSGYWLKRMGQGQDDHPVLKSDDPEVVKSVGHSTTFSVNTWDPDVVKSYLLMLSEKVGRRLRKRGLKGRVISLTLRYSDLKFRSRQASAKDPINDDMEIYRYGTKIMDGMGKFPKAVRLVGISVSELAREDGQGFLVDTYVKKQQMARVVDDLNRKYGSLTVRHAAVDIARKNRILEPPIPPIRGMRIAE